MVFSVAMQKIPNDNTGNRFRDRPTSSAVQANNKYIYKTRNVMKVCK